jgi:cytochrome c
MKALVAIAAALSALAPAAAADIAYGRYLASECVTCHQASGASEGIPSIIGWQPEVFVAALQAYRTGERQHDVMRTIANRYTIEDLEALAAYFASLEEAAGE